MYILTKTKLTTKKTNILLPTELLDLYILSNCKIKNIFYFRQIFHLKKDFFLYNMSLLTFLNNP